MDDDVKKEHIKGKYGIIQSIIAALAVIIAAVIGLYASKLQNANTTLLDEKAKLEKANEVLTSESEQESANAQDTIEALKRENNGLIQDKKDLENKIAKLEADITALTEALNSVDTKETPGFDTLKSDGSNDPNVVSGENSTSSEKQLLPYLWNRNTRIYDGTDSSKYFSVGGNRKSSGVYLNGTTGDDIFAIWDTDGQYNSMTFKIRSISKEQDIVLDVSVDGELQSTYNLKWDDPERDIVVPLNGALNVKVGIPRSLSGWGWVYNVTYGIYDIVFSDTTGKPTEEELYSTSENWMVKLPPYMVNADTKVYDGTDSSKFFMANGKRKDTGISFHANSGAAYAIWDTNSRYKQMSFTICSNATWDGDMEIYANNEYVTTYNLNWDAPRRRFEIPLDGASNVKINIKGNSFDFSLYDISFSA